MLIDPQVTRTRPCPVSLTHKISSAEDDSVDSAQSSAELLREGRIGP